MNISKLINGKEFWIVRHTAFWFVLYFDEFISLFDESFYDSEDMTYWPILLATILLDFAIVYLNLYFLIPKFFQKGHFAKYISITLITVLIGTVLDKLIDANYYVDDEFSLYTQFYFMVINFLTIVGILGIAVSIKISKINYQDSTQLNNLQRLQHETELENLKKQVRPHFLFNTLNSIYVLTRENPETAPESILKLSDLMRYQTYEAAKDEVRLNEEIDFIEKYLDLEKMRRDYLNTSIEINGNLNNIAIPPLLFLPFVENACKYSNSVSGENEFIHISFDCKGQDLFFEIENNIGNQKGFLQDAEHSGLGLENIKKRMQLLFEDNHSLLINESPTAYKVILIINNIFNK